MSQASNAMTGTPQAHYSPPADGPFRCDHCSHFHHERATCDHPNVAADASRNTDGLTIVDGMPRVAPGGCCGYYRPHNK